jgi:hypothetical protein
MRDAAAARMRVKFELLKTAGVGGYKSRAK